MFPFLILRRFLCGHWFCFLLPPVSLSPLLVSSWRESPPESLALFLVLQWLDAKRHAVVAILSGVRLFLPAFSPFSFLRPSF